MATRYSGVTKRSKGYQLSFQYKEKRHREMYSSPHTAKGEKQAYDFLCAVKEDIRSKIFDFSNRFPNSKNAKKTNRQSTTVEFELNEWMRLNEHGLELSTQLDYRSKIRKHLIPAFGHILFNELTRTHIYEWMHQAPIGSKSIRNTLCPLMSMYREAMHGGRIDINPTSSLKLPKFETREPKPFNDQEVSRILSELLRPVRNYFATAFYTGLRTSELIALTWDDFDEPKKQIRVGRAKVRGRIKAPKSKAGKRSVKLSEKAIKALKDQFELTQNEPTIFINPRTGKEWNDDKALRKTYWYPALEKLGIPKREPYQARHTYASRKLSVEKVPVLWLAKQMGHVDSSQIHKNYARWIEH